VIVKRIGYWRNEQRPELPDPSDFVDAEWDEHERDEVASFFDCATVVKTYMGRSTCRICGIQNGSVEYSDGTYLWPEGFAHYIREHNVRPPEELLSAVRERCEELNEIEIDANWWNHITRPS
jgi:hypothetical protein